MFSHHLFHFFVVNPNLLLLAKDLVRRHPLKVSTAALSNTSLSEVLNADCINGPLSKLASRIDVFLLFELLLLLARHDLDLTHLSHACVVVSILKKLDDLVFERSNFKFVNQNMLIIFL